jgi:RNA polymerase sigma-70 factor, ECF subfamily
MIDASPESAAPSPPPLDFEHHRRRLLGLAYRFLGSLSDAEDIVQESYLRWATADHATIANPGAYLARITARLCLDHLKSARVRRETYVGPWLPEPILQEADLVTSSEGEYASDVSVALLLALERLSPLERAAFLLHDVFGLEFDEIAVTLERSPAACRKLATRARDHIRAARPRFTVNPGEGERIAAAFQRATQAGDIAGLARLLAANAVLHSDGGGKVRAALRPILGRDRIVRFFVGITRKKGAPRSSEPARINGLPGFVAVDANGVRQTLAFEILDGLISAIYLIRNPDKLRHLESRSIST